MREFFSIWLKQFTCFQYQQSEMVFSSQFQTIGNYYRATSTSVYQHQRRKMPFLLFVLGEVISAIKNMKTHPHQFG